MLSKLTLASLALSAISAGDMVLDKSIISKWSYFKGSTTDSGLTNIDIVSQAVMGFDYTIGQIRSRTGCV